MEFLDGKLGRKNKNNNNSFPTKIINNDKTYENQKDIVNGFNCYYNTVGVNLLNKLPNSNIANNLTQTNIDTSSCESIYLYETNFSEVSKIVADLKDRSGGVDGINAKSLKILNNMIVGQFTKMVIKP